MSAGDEKGYAQHRQCAVCGNAETRTLTTAQAAFVNTRRWDSPCSECGATRFETSSEEFPDVADSRELLEVGNRAYREAAIAVLRRNLGVFDEVPDFYIGDYIKRVVYPAIGRPYDETGSAPD